jgi:hypothetical protein
MLRGCGGEFYSVESGSVLAGRFRLDQLLGRGGMGEVWRAHDIRLGRDVAVKVLLAPEPDPATAKRFLREAVLPAGLQHPGITVVHDVDQHEGRMFIVMELLDGEDLGKLLGRYPRGLPVRQAIDLATQLVDALAAPSAGRACGRSSSAATSGPACPARPMRAAPVRPYIVIPAALRRRCGLRAGDHVLLAASPGQDMLVAYSFAVVDQAMRTHAAVPGEGRRP